MQCVEPLPHSLDAANLVSEQSELLEKLAMILGTVKPVLETAKKFTGAKADKVIDEIITIGDMLSKC